MSTPDAGPIEPLPGSAPIQPAARAGGIPPTPNGAVTPAAPVERKASFSAPNAKYGQAYDEAIHGKDAQGRAALVVNASLPAGVGLAFDPATRRISGVPRLAGEHPVAVTWQDEHGAECTGSFVIIVNANPRDLWKRIDADPSDPYFKPNEDSALVPAAGGQRIAAGSKRGRSHAHVGACRDDDFFVSHDAASAWSVLVVADGAGSAKSSRKGAQLAAANAGGHLHTALAGEGAVELMGAIGDWERDAASGARRLKEVLYDLFGKAAKSGLAAIEDEAAAKAAAPKDYSTTLLCAVHRPLAGGAFVASFWLGDGAICAYGPAGRVRLMGKPDSGEFAGQTRFLDRAAVSDSNKLWDRIEFDCIPGLTAVILLTDGISDPRFETDNGLADVAKWDALWAEISPALQAADPGPALVEWMDFFMPGHHDDRTIALLW